MQLFGDDLATFLLGAVVFAMAAGALGHVLVKNRDSRGAVAWVGFILFVPALGPIVYWLFGINRVARRAGRLQGLRRQGRLRAAGEGPGYGLGYGLGEGAAHDAAELIAHALPTDRAYLTRIARRVDTLVSAIPVKGNQVVALENGEAAYDAMVQAIDGAQKTVALSSYIFRHDKVGDRFTQALERAKDSGVEVRVLVDGVGAHAGWPLLYRHLRRAGVPVARFLFSFVPWRMPYLNMRNHAKLLIVDGHIAFTGGMNIKDQCLVAEAGPRAVTDVHFCLTGPIVAQVMARFAADWHFTTGEDLEGPGWFPDLNAPGERPQGDMPQGDMPQGDMPQGDMPQGDMPQGDMPQGDMVARGIESGPDFDENPLRWTLLSAILCARHTIRIVTPYFLPDETVLSALRLAVAGGVRVEIFVPERVDLRLLHWAARIEQQVALDAGAQIYLTPAPFDHAKLMTIDGAWTLIGSGNWDMRSLRLNFEYVVEIYGTAMAQNVDALIDHRLARARPLRHEELAGRSLLKKLRDGAAHLLQPYL